MYKKIVTVISMHEPKPQLNASRARGAMAVYISSKKRWEGSRKSFTGFDVLNMVNGVKSVFEVRYRVASEEWFQERGFEWPNSMKEVIFDDD